MPYVCCVTECKGNYPTGPKVSVFSFPRDEKLHRKWISAIPRQNFEPTGTSKVCELHFHPQDILRNTEYFDKNTGKRYVVKLKQPRLRENCVPSVFDGCPKYLSTPSLHRTSPRKRKDEREDKQIENAIAESLKTHSTHQQKYTFTNLNELSQCLQYVKIPEMFSVLHQKECTLFVDLQLEPFPKIKLSVVINHDLYVSLFADDVILKQLGKYVFPCLVNDSNVLADILTNVSQTSEEKNFDVTTSLLEGIEKSLGTLVEKVGDYHKKIVQFLSEQVLLLRCKKNHMVYSSDFLILCCLIFSISPHAYRFLRNYEIFIMPHPNTLNRLCSSFNINPKSEQSDENFLMYIKVKFGFLGDNDKQVTLMVDEIHLKPLLDYSGGSIEGMAYNCEKPANSAYVFMIQSISSSYKDVVHLVPVKTLTAEALHSMIRKIVIGLEKVGFTVFCVVSDNNAINRKALSYFFSPPTLSIVYQHPVDAKRPLFYIIDSVHLLKCIRNNWLNQKDQCMHFPDFTGNSPSPIKTAALSSLKKLHELECDSLIKDGYGLTFKALNPTNLERQNVKLALQIFNVQVAEGLLIGGSVHSIPFFEETSEYIQIINKFWDIVNVRTPLKGVHKRNPYQEPLSDLSGDEKPKFLYAFLDWLDRWEKLGLTSGSLTRETHQALKHTVHALLEVTRYCLEELSMKYILTGKLQTDSLEDRFGKYRKLAGAQYHISFRQVLETENKLRLQSFFPLTMASHNYGDIKLNSIESVNYDELRLSCLSIPPGLCAITLDDCDKTLKSSLPSLTYISGYCVHATLKKLKCEYCRSNLVTENTLHLNDNSFQLIKNLDRGGLRYPCNDVINIVFCSYLVISKLLSEEHEKIFLQTRNHRLVALNITLNILAEQEIFLANEVCNNGHTSEEITKLILWAATNIFLNNYCKIINDTLKPNTKRRKLRTVMKST